MNSFSSRENTFKLTRENIIIDIQNEINVAARQGCFSTIYSKHTYETLESLDITNTLRDSGYNVQKELYKYHSNFHRTKISWR